MDIGRRNVLRALLGATVSNALPRGAMPAMIEREVAETGEASIAAAATPVLSNSFIRAVKEVVSEVLGDKNIYDTSSIVIDLGENYAAYALDKKWRIDPDGDHTTAFLKLTDKQGYIDFKALLHATAAIAELPEALIHESEFSNGAKNKLVNFIDDNFTNALNKLHYLLKLDEKTFLSLQHSKVFKEYISEFNGGDPNILFAHEDIKHYIAEKLEEMHVLLHEVDRLLPEEGEYKGLTTLDALLRTKLQYPGKKYASQVVAQLDDMDEATKVAMMMELNYAEYFNHRLGAYSGMPDIFDQMLENDFQIHKKVFDSFRFQGEYKESLGEKHFRDCNGAMDETLRKVMSRLNKPKSFTAETVAENVIRLSSRLLNRTVMPQAIEVLQQMFGSAALITQEQGALQITFDPQDIQHQVARDLLESPLPNPLNEILAAPVHNAAWETRVSRDLEPPAQGRTA